MARIIIHCQSLQGVGHYVRSREIARHLSRDHAVWLVNGGRCVTGAPLPSSVRTLQLQPLLRDRGELIVPAGSSGTVAEVLHRRLGEVRLLIQQVRPDILMIEHYPFGKYDFESEILAMIDEARALVPSVRIISSVRDIPVSKELASLDQWKQRARIEPLLRRYFDLLLVHGDPTFCRLDQFFPWLSNPPIPIQYTGFVGEWMSARPGRDPRTSASPRNGGTIVVSSGGLGEDGLLNRLALNAWRLLQARGQLATHRLLIFTAPGSCEPLLSEDGTGMLPSGVVIHRFTDRFLARLAEADLSISKAGYNTCVNVLQLGVRRLLLPSAQVEDQWRRAARLAELGLATHFNLGTLTATELADAILDALARRVCCHGLNLDGGWQTTRMIQNLVEQSI